MAPFNSASFPDSLAIAKEDSLTLGTIDAIQKLHIRTVPLGEQPRRLALQEATRTLAVATAGLLGGMGAPRRARAPGAGSLRHNAGSTCNTPPPLRLTPRTPPPLHRSAVGRAAGPGAGHRV